MVNLDSVMKKVRKYARSEEGKARMQAVIDDARENGTELVEAGHLTSEEEMRTLSQLMIEIVRKHLPDSIKETGRGLHSTDILWRYEKNYRKMAIYFDPNDVYRPSLVWEDDDDGGHQAYGVDNIVALLNNGYHASDYVYGFWHNHSPFNHTLAVRSMYNKDSVFVRSVKDRDPLLFMQEAVNEFNRKFGSKYHVIAYCGSQYTGGETNGMAESVLLQS